VLLRPSPTRRHTFLAANHHIAFTGDFRLRVAHYTSLKAETENSKLDGGSCFTSFECRVSVLGRSSIENRRFSGAPHYQGTKPECPLFSVGLISRFLSLVPNWIKAETRNWKLENRKSKLENRNWRTGIRKNVQK